MNVAPDDAALPNSLTRRNQPNVYLETLVLLGSAPVLLFPTAVPALTLIALLALSAVWLLPLWQTHRPGLPATPFNVPLLLFGLSIMVAIAVTADPEQTLDKAAGVILGVAVWRFLSIYGRRPTVLQWSIGGFLVVALGFTVIGMIGLEVMPKFPLLANLSPARYLAFDELAGFSIHPNQLAGLIGLYLPLLLSLLLAWQPRRHRLLFKSLLSIALLLAVVSLILTQSRGGWFGALAGVLVLLAGWAVLMPPSRNRQLLRVFLGGVTVAAVALVLWIGPAQLQSYWLEPPAETALGTLSTLSYRQELWPFALTAVGDFPFTGTGLGTFREVAFRLYPLPLSPAADIGHAHNIFLQTALDLGIPGLIAYVALLVVGLASSWIIARRNLRLRPVALGLLAGLVALHVFGLADALALGAKPAVLFWAALGLIAAMANLQLRDATAVMPATGAVRQVE